MPVSTHSVKQSVQRILAEDVIPIADARAELAESLGWRPDKSTVFRWCLKGVGGTKLEHVRLGNRIFTSRQALTRFAEARSAGQEQELASA